MGLPNFDTALDLDTGLDMTMRKSRRAPKDKPVSLMDAVRFKPVSPDELIPKKGKPEKPEKAPTPVKHKPQIREPKVIDPYAKRPESPRGARVSLPRHSSSSGMYTVSSYPRQCIVEMSFKSLLTKNNFLNNRRIATMTGSSKTKMTFQEYNSTYAAYLGREKATLDEKPEYDDASKEFPLYSVVDGETKRFSEKEAREILKSSPTFTVVISPEDENVNLTELTTKFMQKSLLKNLTALPTAWFAANHYNTDNPHTHIICSGVSKDGKKIHTKATYLSSSRHIKDAQRILTNMKGPRTWDEELNAIKKKSRLSRRTTEDTFIEKHSENTIDGRVYRSAHSDIQDLHNRNLINSRLEFLQEKNLVDKKDNTFVLSKDFDSELVKMEFKEAFGLRASDETYLEGKNTYKGKIEKFVRPDESKDRVMFLIRGEDGKIYLHEENIAPDSKSIIPSGYVDINKVKRQMKINFGEIGHGRV